MKVNIHKYFAQYELLDCGHGKKLERFNNVVLIRPEINASSTPAWSHEMWLKMADAEFVQQGKIAGQWQIIKKLPEDWLLQYNNLSIAPQLTKFKHIGVFPEQALNWLWLSKQYHKLAQSPKLLNLFGYTGMASLAANAAGFEVTHVDAIKQVVNWGKTNMQLSGLEGIKWLIDDASKFVKRAARRGNKYDAIVLDPPAKGRGPKGELWNIDKDLENLLKDLPIILNQKCFVILNLYSNNINIPYLHKLILTHFKDFKIEFCDQVFGQSQTGNDLSHGFFVRLSRF